jgi:hypothetical protein
VASEAVRVADRGLAAAVRDLVVDTHLLLGGSGVWLR